jgi:hypothetical protein
MTTRTALLGVGLMIGGALGGYFFPPPTEKMLFFTTALNHFITASICGTIFRNEFDKTATELYYAALASCTMTGYTLMAPIGKRVLDEEQK